MRKAFVVGVGPGSSGLVTDGAKRAVRESGIVLGWDLDLLPVRNLLDGKEIFLQDVTNYNEISEKAADRAKESGKTIAIVRVGDPCISSGLPGLLEIFKEFDIRIVPGISSVQVAAAYARINIDDSAIVSFHDFGDQEMEKQYMLQSFRYGKHVIMLASPDLTPNEAAKFMISHGIDEGTACVACSNLTLPDEEVFYGSLKDVAGREFHWLTVIVFINPSTPSPAEVFKMWKAWKEKHAQVVRESSG